jgi:hypothetical protein
MAINTSETRFNVFTLRYYKNDFLSVGLKKKEKTTCQKNILNKLKEKES